MPRIQGEKKKAAIERAKDALAAKNKAKQEAEANWTPDKPLINPKHELFAIAYYKSFNASRAAKAAGYMASDPESFGQVGYQLLQRPEVKARVACLRDAHFKAAQMGPDEVLSVLSGLSRVTKKDLMRDDGSFKPLSEMTDEEARAISSITFDRDEEGNTYVKSIKLEPKVAAARTLAQIHKLLGAEVQINIGDDFAERLKKAKERGK